MTRKKLPLAENDLYARHPLRIIRALKTGELEPLGYLILKFLVDEIEAPGRGAEAIYTLEELGRLIGWSRSDEWLRQKLHALKDAHWIDFDEPRSGPNAAWIFRLKRAAIDGEGTGSPTNLQLQTPSELEINSNSAETEAPSNLQPEGVSDPIESPTRPSLEKSRAESEIENLCSKEEAKLDRVGKTTSEEPPPRELEPEFPPLLDAFEPNPFHNDPQQPLDPSLAADPLTSDLHRRRERGEL
jgi:hypothetical protein